MVLYLKKNQILDVRYRTLLKIRDEIIYATKKGALTLMVMTDHSSASDNVNFTGFPVTLWNGWLPTYLILNNLSRSTIISRILLCTYFGVPQS